MNFLKTEPFFSRAESYIARRRWPGEGSIWAKGAAQSAQSLWAKASVRAVSYCKNGPRHRWAAGVPRLRLRNDCCTTTAASQ